MKEFWSELVTKKSWEKLVEISKEFDFILIGGWAAYLWTEKHKSKDIDIVVDYEVLDYLRQKYGLNKNERLRKYEIRMDDFDIDVYVSHYSKLAIAAEELQKYTKKIKGINIVAPEILLILKQGAEIERRGSVKGKKDLIDILALLYYAPFELKKYRELLQKFKLKEYEDVLEKEVMLFDTKDIDYLGINFNQFSKWKKAFLKKLKEP